MTRLLRLALVLGAAGVAAVPLSAQTPVAARARAAVLDILDDPRSALFRQVITVDSRTACGRVSARNALGGMVSQFFVFRASGSDVRFLDTDAFSEREAFRALCGESIRLPFDAADAATRAVEWDAQRLALIAYAARARCLDRFSPAPLVMDSTKSVPMTITEGDLISVDPAASRVALQECVVREEQALARVRPFFAALTPAQKRAALQQLAKDRR